MIPRGAIVAEAAAPRKAQLQLRGENGQRGLVPCRRPRPDADFAIARSTATSAPQAPLTASSALAILVAHPTIGKSLRMPPAAGRCDTWPPASSTRSNAPIRRKGASPSPTNPSSRPAATCASSSVGAPCTRAAAPASISSRRRGVLRGRVPVHPARLRSARARAPRNGRP